MEKPLVSVLLPSYNDARFVESAVRSVMEQQGVSFELIVIDDGSTDDSPQILEALQKELGFRYIHRENRGLVRTLNELLSLANGKYFCSFSSDDRMAPGRLAVQSAYLESHPEKIACFGLIQLMDADEKINPNPDSRYLRSVPQVSFEEFFLGKKELNGCTEMLRLEELKKMGGYDERFPFEDFPLWLKILKANGPQAVLSHICTYYRIHGKNMSSDGHLMYGTFLKVLEDYRDIPLYKKAVRIWKSHCFSNLAYHNKVEAFRRLPELASFSLPFLKRFPKLFIPRCLLKH